MPDSELDRLCGYLSVHGQHVSVLAVKGSQDLPQRLRRVLAVAPALTHLKRLEVEQEHSLMLLAPVLGQLPHLQHLAAHVSIGCPPQAAAGVMGRKTGAFLDAKGVAVHQVPDMQQLCPSLKHLRLTLDTDGKVVGADARLKRLLPSHLQHLVLVAPAGGYCVHVDHATWGHLTALQQLDVHAVVLVKHGEGAVGQPWESLQQLRVRGVGLPLADNRNSVLQLAPKVTECHLRPRNGSLAGLGQLVNLKQLAIDWGDSMPAGMADALAALTGLQHLSLTGQGLPAAVQLAAGVPTLRHLQLGSMSGQAVHVPALIDSLGQCTQLTSLALLDSRYKCAPAMEQLTRLRCLAVDAELLSDVAEAGNWLAPLTSLTRLCVALVDVIGILSTSLSGSHIPYAPGQEGNRSVMSDVQHHLSVITMWPASMQQVVFRVSGSINLKASCWRFGPTAPGGAEFGVWVEDPAGLAPGWARPFRPCPHLPGVWELQEEEPGCW
jgi:hypothetical protein